MEGHAVKFDFYWDNRGNYLKLRNGKPGDPFQPVPFRREYWVPLLFGTLMIWVWPKNA